MHILLQTCLSILFLAVLSILFKLVHVHGLLARPDRASSRVLFAGRRHGDVTNFISNVRDQVFFQVVVSILILYDKSVLINTLNTPIQTPTLHLLGTYVLVAEIYQA